MTRFRTLLALGGLALLARPVLGQDRAVVVQVLGGGYSHIANLNQSGPDAHFKVGYNMGAAVGVHVTRNLAFHGDFTFASSKGLGDVDFAGDRISRYFYGAHVELRYPFGNGLAPFVFGGGGAVTVDQKGPTADDVFGRFTRGAGTFGAGLSYAIPGAPVELLAEGKALTYKWVAAGFDRMQWDLTYSLGFAYRFRY
jgi:opacity protein-like surface antigen